MPTGILDYLAFAKKYIAACEERHGREAVEAALDAAHALMDQGVFRYRRPPQAVQGARPWKSAAAARSMTRNVQRAVAHAACREEPPSPPPVIDPEDEFGGELKLPEENILYFIEKNSPSLMAWQRETLRIVRNLSQYFYPQRQLKS